MALREEEDHIYAEFLTTSDSRSYRVNIHCSKIYLFHGSQENMWEIKVNLKTFEIIHGLSRITKLVPDKLATAIAINKEELYDPEDDGGFLIQLVIDLIDYYITSLNRQDLFITDCEDSLDSRLEDIAEESENVFTLPEVIIELLDLVIEYKNKLLSIKRALRLRNEEDFKREGLSLLRMSDRILEVCNVYLDFVHPIYLDIERHGMFDETKIEDLKKKIVLKLAEKKNKLQDEFDILTGRRARED